MSELTGIFKLYAGRTLRFPPRITVPGVNANALHFPPRITQPVNRLCGTQGKSVPQTCLAAGRFSFGKPGHKHVKRRMRFTCYDKANPRLAEPPQRRAFHSFSGRCRVPVLSGCETQSIHKEGLMHCIAVHQALQSLKLRPKAAYAPLHRGTRTERRA